MSSSRSRRLAEIGNPLRPADGPVVMRRAVVLGASVAGLLAARVLSDHAEEVVVIERDGTDNGDHAMSPARLGQLGIDVGGAARLPGTGGLQ